MAPPTVIPPGTSINLRHNNIKISNSIVGDEPIAELAHLLSDDVNFATNSPAQANRLVAWPTDATTLTLISTGGAGLPLPKPVLTAADVLTGENNFDLSPFVTISEFTPGPTPATFTFPVSAYNASGGDGSLTIDGVSINLGDRDLSEFPVALIIANALLDSTKPYFTRIDEITNSVVLIQRIPGAAGNVELEVQDASYSTFN